MAWVAPAVAAIGSAMGGTAAGTAAAGTAAGAAGAGTAAGLGAGAGTAAGLGSTAAGLGSTAAGTGAGTLGMAAGAGTAVPLATGAASTLPAAASSAGSSAAGSSGLFDTVLGMGKDIAKDSLSSAVKSKLQQALSPTSTASPQMPQAQAPTGLDAAAAQNRPQSAGTGSFQANIGPGYQLGERAQAKIQGLSDEEAGLLQRVLSSTSGSIR